MRGRLRRNIVVVTMAVLVCAAAALNWKYSADAGGESAEEAGKKILGEAELVSGQKGKEAPDPGVEGESPLDSMTVSAGEDYFASARLTRQQARDSAISLLQDAAGQEDADEETANEASQGIQVLASYTLKEAQVENLVTAKGYKDCVAFMGEDSISVVVSTDSGELTREDVAKITDIAVNETGYAPGGVRIMTAN